MELAADGGEIISVDSMQVYRGMDIGTAKPSRRELASVPHHMVDVAEPEVDYTVAEFQRAARRALDEALERTDRVVIVGGSGLHFRAIVDISSSLPPIRQCGPRSMRLKPLKQLLSCWRPTPTPGPMSISRTLAACREPSRSFD